jgi:hypothetical protein
VAFLVAGALWLGLGILLILTVFGTLIGVAMAYLVGLRRNVLAARIGAVMGVLMFIPCQLILDVTGCRRDTCSLEPYLLAYGIPAVVTVLNLLAGWPVRATDGTVASNPVSLSVAGSPASAAPLPASDTDVAPGQQLLWDILPGSAPAPGQFELQGEPANTAPMVARQADLDPAGPGPTSWVEPMSGTLWAPRRLGRQLDGDRRSSL